jgi:hypothetical protein
MKNKADYILETGDKDRRITIRPVNQRLIGSYLPAIGVFRLSEGNVELGEIVFDDNMIQWEYTGMGDLTHQQAAKIALFIKEQMDR